MEQIARKKAYINAKLSSHHPPSLILMPQLSSADSSEQLHALLALIPARNFYDMDKLFVIVSTVSRRRSDK